MTTLKNSIPTEFQDIAPYDDSQYREKIATLVKEPGFEHAVRYVMPNIEYSDFVETLLKTSTQNEFQTKIVGSFLEGLVKSTSDGLSSDGFENITPERCYTFITNHRDIVLDSAFLNLCFIRNDKPLSQIAIGNNLLIFDWITDLVKLNRSFIVKRDTGVIEALNSAKHLSAYIHYVINERHEPIWIAQREGRAKDSNDWTQESLVKMIGLSPDCDTKTNILGANLAPVSISYEFDPNDYLKAREFLLKRRDPEYKKTQRDDLFSMETGIVGYKGRIHMRVGKCINEELSKFEGTSRQEVVHEACRLIDKTIHSGYEIYPCNYIAYDEVENVKRFSDLYTSDDIASFNKYINSQLDRVDVENVTPEEREYMRVLMLSMYANPLRNHIAAVAADTQ